MIMTNATGYYVVNLNTGLLVFHEPSQKVKAHERLATEAEIAAGLASAAPVAEPSSAEPLSALVSVKATGTVSDA